MKSTTEVQGGYTNSVTVITRDRTSIHIIESSGKSSMHSIAGMRCTALMSWISALEYGTAFPTMTGMLDAAMLPFNNSSQEDTAQLKKKLISASLCFPDYSNVDHVLTHGLSLCVRQWRSFFDGRSSVDELETTGFDSPIYGRNWVDDRDWAIRKEMTSWRIGGQCTDACFKTRVSPKALVMSAQTKDTAMDFFLTENRRDPYDDSLQELERMIGEI